jgi:hypothetical protein
MFIARSRFEGLRMLSGALIWAAHFLALYGFAALACARGFAHTQWLGIGVPVWTTGTATMIALATLLAIVATSIRRWPSVAFIDGMTAAVAALAILAVIWETLPVLMLRPCV